MNKYTRRRDQRSRIWRKRRERQKEHIKTRNMRSRNHPKPGKMPNVDTSLKGPLMQRVLLGVLAAMGPKRVEPKRQHQQQQAR